MIDNDSQFCSIFVFKLTDIILCSASIDGRVYVWKISEGPGEEDKSQISGVVVLAIHFNGEEGSIHPRVCWHCHKQVSDLAIHLTVYPSHCFISYQESSGNVMLQW